MIHAQIGWRALDDGPGRGSSAPRGVKAALGALRVVDRGPVGAEATQLVMSNSAPTPMNGPAFIMYSFRQTDGGAARAGPTEGGPLRYGSARTR